MVLSDENVQLFWGKEDKINLIIDCHHDLSQIGSRRFTYKQLKRVTNDFARIIGRGAFAKVYHGCLKDGTQVAVKMYNVQSSNAELFFYEVQHLARLHHNNVILLVGYCDEEKHRATVLNYASGGNLSENLRGRSVAETLSWQVRLRIALGVAKGLEHLHKRCVPPLIHRNVNSGNILLDHNLEAEIAGFALSTVLDNDLDYVVRGTTGLLDPEYFLTGKPSIMSDVYSFGVVLFELITGRAPFCYEDHKGYNTLVDWVHERVDVGNIDDIIDPKLDGAFDASSVSNILNVAIQCTLRTTIERPSISDVVNQLQRSFTMEAVRLRKQKKEQACEVNSNTTSVR